MHVEIRQAGNLLADQLESGQGRFRRVWHAPPGGLWLTLVLVNTLLPEHFRLYPLAAGVACCETVRHYGIKAHLKWVNDVHLGGRKMAGVLVETARGERFGEEYGRKVLFGFDVQQNPQYRATLEGLDPTGGLILRHLGDNTLITEHAGELRYLD